MTTTREVNFRISWDFYIRSILLVFVVTQALYVASKSPYSPLHLFLSPRAPSLSLTQTQTLLSPLSLSLSLSLSLYIYISSRHFARERCLSREPSKL
jgi:hypothetical protein